MTKVISFSKSTQSDLFDRAAMQDLQDIDVDASIDSFDDILAARIEECYPDADVRIDPLSSNKRWASGFGDEDSDVAYQVQLMAEELFNDGNVWMVYRESAQV